MVSLPSSFTEPLRWLTMPMIDFSVVVLPAPLRPSRVTTSPCATSKLTPCRICDSPYHDCRSRTLSIAPDEAASGMRDSQVRLDHVRVLRDRGVVALRQHLSAREHG